MITGFLMAATGLYGYWSGLPYYLLPLVVAGSSFFFHPLQPWADSEHLGANAELSAFLKMLVQFLGLVASVGFWACLVLVGTWIGCLEAFDPNDPLGIR